MPSFHTFVSGCVSVEACETVSAPACVCEWVSQVEMAGKTTVWVWRVRRICVGGCVGVYVSHCQRQMAWSVSLAAPPEVTTNRTVAQREVALWLLFCPCHGAALSQGPKVQWGGRRVSSRHGRGKKICSSFFCRKSELCECVKPDQCFKPWLAYNGPYGPYNHITQHPGLPAGPSWA